MRFILTFWLIMEEKESISSNYKKYLKQLILENLPDVTFITNKNVNKPDHLCSTKTERNAFDIGIAESTGDNLGKIWSVAKLIRKEVLEKENWIFNGTSLIYITKMDFGWSHRVLKMKNVSWESSK